MNENTNPENTAIPKAGFKKLAIEAARLADAKKAEEVAVYDVSGRSPLADFVLVAAVDNPAQLEAVEEDISIKFKQKGRYPLHREGSQSKHWRVLDYGGLIVHVFEKQARENVLFDKLYADCARIRWQAGSEAPAAAAKPNARPAGVRKAAIKKAKAAPRKDGTALKKAKAVPQKGKTASRKAKRPAVKRTGAGKKSAKKKNR